MVTIGQILETFDYFLFENLVAQFVTYNYHHQISFRYVDIRQATTWYTQAPSVFLIHNIG